MSYREVYEKWCNDPYFDEASREELKALEGNEAEIEDRFYRQLEFGTGGLRGVIGAGTNRMNIYVVRQANPGPGKLGQDPGRQPDRGHQLRQPPEERYLCQDRRRRSGGKRYQGAHFTIALMPVPALSFCYPLLPVQCWYHGHGFSQPGQVQRLQGLGPDGCQMTDDAAAIVYDEIQKTDVLTGAKYISFAEGVEQGLIRFVGDDCKKALYDAIEARQVRPGLCKTAGLKLVYSPLNGSGLVPVTHVLNDMGITDITIVPEQEYPNGYFTTCSYPNPKFSRL